MESGYSVETAILLFICTSHGLVSLNVSKAAFAMCKERKSLKRYVKIVFQHSGVEKVVVLCSFSVNFDMLGVTQN